MSDLPKGYRWATEDEMHRPDAILVKRTVSSNGHVYTQDESDVAVPEDFEDATITVSYGGETLTFHLEGSGLSEVKQMSGVIHRYFTTGEKDYIANKIERWMVETVSERKGV